MVKRQIKPWIFLLIPLACSCNAGFIAFQDIVIAAPPRPTVWQGMEGLAYRVSWVDQNGSKQEFLVAEGESITIRIWRGCDQAILFQPIAPYGWCKPAGFLYPFDLETGFGLAELWRPAKGRASFGSGYAATVALAMEKAGYDPWKWPLEKLADPGVIKQKDPWSLAPWTTAERLIQGNFRVSLFPSAKTAFVLPEDEPWWPESALCPPAQTRPCAGTDDAEEFVMLPEGLHTFSNGSELLCVKIANGAVLSQRKDMAP